MGMIFIEIELIFIFNLFIYLRIKLLRVETACTFLLELNIRRLLEIYSFVALCFKFNPFRTPIEHFVIPF